MPKEHRLHESSCYSNLQFSSLILFSNNFLSISDRSVTASLYSFSILFRSSIFSQQVFSWREMFTIVLLIGLPIFSKCLASFIRILNSSEKFTSNVLLPLLSFFWIKIFYFRNYMARSVIRSLHSLNFSFQYFSSQAARSRYYLRISPNNAGSKVSTFVQNLMMGPLTRCMIALAQEIAPAT